MTRVVHCFYSAGGLYIRRPANIIALKSIDAGTENAQEESQAAI